MRIGWNESWEDFLFAEEKIMVQTSISQWGVEEGFTALMLDLNRTTSFLESVGHSILTPCFRFFPC